jgi:hypothetical protein
MAPLAYHFGVRPWEINLLTIDQFYGLCDACDELAKEE